MNTIRFLSVAALCAAVLSSCTVREENILITPNAGKPVEVQFASDSISVLETKVQNNLWTGLERIGIFMVENGTSNIMNGVSNREYKNPNESSLSSVTFSSTNPICYPLATTPKVAFMAYYPHKALTDIWTYPIDVSTQTSQSAVDLMRAEADNSGNGYDNTYGSTVNLHFYHKLSKLIINVVAGEGVTESLSGMSVRITNLPYQGSLNLSAEANTVQRQADPTGNISPLAIVDGSQYEAIVIPGGTAGIKLSFTTGISLYEATIPSPAEWLSGRKYSYTVTLKKYDTQISGTVEDWNGSTPDAPTIGYPNGPGDAIEAGTVFEGEIQVIYVDLPISASFSPAVHEPILRTSPAPGVLRLTAYGQLEFDNTVNKIIQEIRLPEIDKTYKIGRHTSSGPLFLNIDKNGKLKFRPADADGYIPIGSYAEFQLISGTLEELYADHGLSGKYKQDADLNFWGLQWTIGYDAATFTGTFKGNGKRIYNAVGELFREIGTTGTLRNIHMDNSNITVGKLTRLVNRNLGTITECSYTGDFVWLEGSSFSSIAGVNDGTISKCSYTGNFEAPGSWNLAIGGIVEFNDYNGVISECYVTGNISDGSSVGGIAGRNSGDISECHYIGNISPDNLSNIYIGGIAGSNDLGNISECSCTGTILKGGGIVGYNSGLITACNNTATIASNGGGIAGENRYIITECYNSGSISNGGGIAGYNYSGISKCHNTGTISDNGGGIVRANFGEIIECYNTGNISGNNIGGIASSNNGKITACYNVANLSGGAIGGVVLSNNGGNITACYNTGSITASGQGEYATGGVVGSNTGGGLITACYNAGSVVMTGSANVGGVLGNLSPIQVDKVTACYWFDAAGDNAICGIGVASSNVGATPFAGTAWPSAADHLQWGGGIGNGDGQYWKNLGSWNNGNPIFPKLYFEQ